MKHKIALNTVFKILIAVTLILGIAVSYTNRIPVSRAASLETSEVGIQCIFTLNLSHISCVDGQVEVHFVLLDVPNGVTPGSLTYNLSNGTSRTVSPGKHTGNVWHYTDYLSDGYINIVSATVKVSGESVSLHNPGEYAGDYNCAPTPTNTPVTPTATNTPKTPTATNTPVTSPTPSNTPEKPTASPTPGLENRSEVGVLCQGCWSNQAILWVGGSEQPALTFVPNHDGWPAVHWSLWNSEPWVLRIKVTLPAGLDPNRWKFILWTGTGPKDYSWTDEVTFTINPRQSVVLDFQLVDTFFWQ